MTGVAIGLDLGTSALRAALVDASGNGLAFAACPIEARSRRWPEACWDAVGVAISKLERSANLSSVRAIAVDGTSGTVLPIDAAGVPLAETSLYSDRAPADAVAAVAEVAAPDSAARGATSPLARLLTWRGLPDLARVLHEADWLTGRLTGRFDVSDANNALKTGYDPRLGAWPDWVTELCGGPVLPDVVAAGTDIGNLLPEIADRLGLPSGVRVAAGTTDGCAAFLATGASGAGDAVTSLGTTLTIKLLSETPVFSPQYGIYSHLVRGRWLAGGASNSGGAALLRHFPAATLANLSTRIDPDTDSPLDYYPLPAPGERFPIADPALPPRETPRPADDAAFLHGLLQGIARIEALAYRRLEELGAPAITTVRTVGGGAANPAWTRIRTRLLGVAMPPPRSEEAAIGAASLALAALES
jgi:sugar (pentulose or hexulose) kinase